MSVALLTLAEPLALLAALPLAAADLLGRRRGPAGVVLAPANLLVRDRPGEAPLPASWRTRLRFLPGALVAVGLLLAVVALARPVERHTVRDPVEGIDILLCLDSSSSMATDDLAPAGRSGPRSRRWEVSRDAARRFVERRPKDRIGLLTFARYPDLVSPPTLDHRALVEMLDAVRLVASDGPEDATGIGAAVAAAADVFRGAPDRSRVVILLTDGEENVAVEGTSGQIAPAHAAQHARRLGVRVHAIVAGTGRPGPGGTWLALDSDPIRRLAESTGGGFHVARDAAAVDALYASIDALEKAPAGTPRVVEEDRRRPFLVAALALLALALALRIAGLRVIP